MRRSLIAGVLLIGFLYLLSLRGLADERTASSGAPIPPVVATVNGKAITSEQYQKLWDQMVMERGGQGGIKKPEEQQAMKQSVLESLISVELLTEMADQMNVQVDPKEVEQRVLDVEKRLGGRGDLDEALQAWGMTRGEYVAEIGKSLRIQRLVRQEVFDKITVGPNEVKEFYESNPKVFEKPEEVRARHIVILVAGDATDEERREAREAIEKIAERIKGGEAFEVVAEKVSQDGTASQGGDLGYFSRGRMAPQLEKVAFSLEKGKVSDVVETSLGYHLVKVEDKRPPSLIPLEEAEPDIAAYLKRKKVEEGMRVYIEGLRAKAKIERTDF